MRFNKGDKAVIIANSAEHRFEIGEQVTIVEVNSEDGFYMASNAAGDWWAVNESDIEGVADAKLPAPPESNKFTSDETAFIIGAMTLFITIEGGLPYVDFKSPAIQKLIASGEQMRRETGVIDVVRATAMFEGIAQKLVDNSDLDN